MRQVQEEEVAKLQVASQATSEVDVARAQPHLSSALSEIARNVSLATRVSGGVYQSKFASPN